MKKKYPILVGALCLLMTALQLTAQQVPISITRTFLPGIENPAKVGLGPLNSISLAHQGRNMIVSGWSSSSQFLHFSSAPRGYSRQFGWGLGLLNDLEHSERRLSISPSFGVRVLETDQWRASVGISMGLINWASNYTDVAVYDRTDELLERPSHFFELNAGAGAELAFQSNWLKAEGGVRATQLPGNLITDRINGISLLPHLLAKGEALAQPVYNLYVGPVAFFKRTFNHGDTTFQSGRLDVGLKAELPRQKVWAAGSYRIDRAALNLGFGLELSRSDTVEYPDMLAWFFQLNAGFSYPMAQYSAFGPGFEIGLDIQFGRRQNSSGTDTLHFARTFWKNDGFLNNHKVEYLQANGPRGLTASVRNVRRKVELLYEFPDQSYRYAGDGLVTADSLVANIGNEWPGVDGILENVVSEVIPEALTPNTAGISDPENLEALKGLVSLELSCRLTVDEYGILNGADGMVYEGELGTNNATNDTLFLSLVFDGADTTIGIARYHYVNNLELAALKLHAMRNKLHYELLRRYGNEMVFLREGDRVDFESLEGRKPVFLKKLRVTSNNANQQAFQVNRIRLNFLRFKENVEEKDGWIPNDMTVVQSGKQRKRKGRRGE